MMKIDGIYLDTPIVSYVSSRAELALFANFMIPKRLHLFKHDYLLYILVSWSEFCASSLHIQNALET